MKKNTKTALMIALLPIFVVILFVTSVVNESKDAGKPKVISVYPNTKPIAEFELRSAQNRKLTNKDLNGHFSLVFFGYSHCPDVCPTTLANMAKIYKGLAVDVRAKLQVVFISVDPKRDSPDALKDYVQYFDKSFLGITGNEQVLMTLAKSMGALFIVNKADENGNYLVDHTSKVFLLNSKAKLMGMFDGQVMPPAKQYPLQDIIKDLTNIIKN